MRYHFNVRKQYYYLFKAQDYFSEYTHEFEDLPTTYPLLSLVSFEFETSPGD
jgi:hypothetical protein